MNPQPSVLETAALPVELHPYSGWPGGARTRDILLNRQALCRLSYRPIWCLRTDLNRRSAGLQPAALPSELPRQMVGRERLELPEGFPDGFTVRAATSYGIPAHIGAAERTRTSNPVSRAPAFQAGRLPLAYGCVCAAGKPVAKRTACDSSFGDRGGTRTHNPLRSTDFRDRLATITALCHGEEGETRTPKPHQGARRISNPLPYHWAHLSV